MVLREAIHLELEKTRNEAQAKNLHLAWALGHKTLYKFKGFAGDQRAHVIDILENSRIYFSTADQFNDPFDVAPVVRLAGDPNDSEVIRALEVERFRILKHRGWDDARITAETEKSGTDAASLPRMVMQQVREWLRSDNRFVCLTAEQNHPLQWAHYADHHRGLCLHFSIGQESVFQYAEKVRYRTNRVPLLIPISAQTNDELYERMALSRLSFGDMKRSFGSSLPNPRNGALR